MKQYCTYKKGEAFRCLEFDVQHDGYQWTPVGKPVDVTDIWPQDSLADSEFLQLIDASPDPDMPLFSCPVLEGWTPVDRDWVRENYRGMTPEEFKKWKEETGYDG